MKKIKPSRNYFWLIFLSLLAIFSFSFVADYVTSAPFAKASIQYLSEKQTNVLAIAASSTAASTALTLLPGDIASPLANQLADINKYAFIVLLAVFIEKFFVTLTGVFAFKFLIPLACFLLIINLAFFRKRHIHYFAIKLTLFSLVLFSAIPLSIQASKIIEKTHQISVQEVIQETDKNIYQLEEGAKNTESKESFWEKTVDFVKDGWKLITGQATTLLQSFTNTLNRLLEAVVVLIVTSCVIPLSVLFFLFWFSKKIFSLDIEKIFPSLKRIHYLS